MEPSSTMRRGRKIGQNRGGRNLIRSLTLVAFCVMAAACSRSTSVAREPVPAPSASSSVAVPTDSAAPDGDGSLVFSRATPEGEGQPVEATLRRLSEQGAVGEVVVEHATYRSAPSWSPKGDAFAYRSRDGISLWRHGGSSLLARCRPSTCAGYGPPAWSPSGSAIAFGGDRDGVPVIFTVPVDGGEPAVLADLQIRGAPAWSPAGAEMAVIATDGEDATILVLSVASGQVQRSLDLAGLPIGEALAWSAAGSTLAFEVQGSSQGDPAGIYLTQLDPADPRLLTSCPGEGCQDLAPAFSPDGRSVVFTRARCDDPGSDCFVGDVWAIPTDGGPAHALTRGPALDCCAAWMPSPP